MQSLKFARWSVEPRQPVAQAARVAVVSGLHSVSSALAALAAHLSRPAPAAPVREPHLEFCLEAGAPEGALYLDGKLVGWVPGVKRL